MSTRAERKARRRAPLYCPECGQLDASHYELPRIGTYVCSASAYLKPTREDSK